MLAIRRKCYDFILFFYGIWNTNRNKWYSLIHCFQNQSTKYTRKLIIICATMMFVFRVSHEVGSPGLMYLLWIVGCMCDTCATIYTTSATTHQNAKRTEYYWFLLLYKIHTFEVRATIWKNIKQYAIFCNLNKFRLVFFFISFFFQFKLHHISIINHYRHAVIRITSPHICLRWKQFVDT